MSTSTTPRPPRPRRRLALASVAALAALGALAVLAFGPSLSLPDGLAGLLPGQQEQAIELEESEAWSEQARGEGPSGFGDPGETSSDEDEDDEADADARDPGEPVRIEIPAIGVDDEVIAVGLLDDGAMEVPDFGLAGWYDLGPKPGDLGPAVIAAHVDSRDGPDVFFGLHELEPGDEIHVHDADGNTETFTVTDREQAPKDALPEDRIWHDAPDDQPTLLIITCGGTFDHAERSYQDNIIVYADDHAG